MRSEKEVFQQLRENLRNFKLDETVALTREALENKISAYDILMKGLAKGMEDVGELYESGEYFLSELVASAAIINECMKILLPKLREVCIEAKGKIVIGTVLGDIHDIGKNLVVALASASGFEVIDLGIDVPAEKFVEAVKQHNPDILAMSALLSSTMLNMKAVVEVLQKAGVRDKVHVVIGGRPITEDYARKLGVYYAKDAVEGVKLFKKLIEETRAE